MLATVRNAAATPRTAALSSTMMLPQRDQSRYNSCARLSVCQRERTGPPEHTEVAGGKGALDSSRVQKDLGPGRNSVFGRIQEILCVKYLTLVPCLNWTIFPVATSSRLSGLRTLLDEGFMVGLEPRVFFYARDKPTDYSDPDPHCPDLDHS